jgi:hypothetical protein
MDMPQPGLGERGPEDGSQDMLEFGAAREPRSRAWSWLYRPLARRLAAGAAVIALIVAGTVLLTARGHAPSRTSGGRAAAGLSQPQWYAGSRPVVVETLHHPLLGEHSGWELFAVGGGWEPGAVSGVVVRVQFAAGVVSRTTMPPLASSGLAAIIAGPDQVIVRPTDYVPGYLVPDGGTARPLPAGLGQGGMTIPGPRPGQVWVTVSADAGVDGYAVLRLVTMDGARVGQSTLDLPAGGYLSVPDGQGYALVQKGGAVYDARPAAMRRVATGALVAVGPSAWLVSRCRSATRCVNVVIDPATGGRRTLPGSADLVGYPTPSWPPGLISPDGRLAALPSYGPGNSAAVRFVDLRTGAERTVAIALDAQAWPGLAWSPDSRWLFWVAVGGTVRAMDPWTGQVSGLGVALPPVTFLATQSG